MAGEGTLTVDVRDPNGSVYTELKQKGAARYEVTFTPTNTSDHTVDITFNGDRIPGKFKVYRTKTRGGSKTKMLPLQQPKQCSHRVNHTIMSIFLFIVKICIKCRPMPPVLF